MAGPASIKNTDLQSTDTGYADDGIARVKLMIGIKDVGLDQDAGWQGAATHQDADEFVASDGIVVAGGVDRTGTDTARPLIVDAEGRLFVDTQRRRVRVAQTPTISSGVAYTAKDAVGALLTFAGVARTGILTGLLESVTIVDKGQQIAALDLVLFAAAPAAPTDNLIFDPTDAELADCVGVVPIEATDYADFSDNSVATKVLDHPYVLPGTSLFGVLVARGTPTYTSTSDLVVSLTVRTD